MDYLEQKRISFRVGEQVLELIPDRSEDGYDYYTHRWMKVKGLGESIGNIILCDLKNTNKHYASTHRVFNVQGVLNDRDNAEKMFQDTWRNLHSASNYSIDLSDGEKICKSYEIKRLSNEFMDATEMLNAACYASSIL